MSGRTRLRGVVPRRLRLPLVALALLALALSGCAATGEPRQIRTQGETEGLYIELGELLYQVQVSRQLNPADPEDQEYLSGLPEGTSAPTAGQVWFAIFMRVQNVSAEPQTPAETFRIVDADENEYDPILLDPEINPYAYEPGVVPAKGQIPAANTTARNGPTQGSLILYKLEVGSLQNRPMELIIQDVRLDLEGTISLDV